MMPIFYFFASCPRGLENILLGELDQLQERHQPQTENIQVIPGGVAFSGTMLTMMKLNLHSRVASRVLWKLTEKPYQSEDDLYLLSRHIDWSDLFTVDKTIKVNVTAIKASLKSLEFVGLRVKDGICDHFRSKIGTRPHVNIHQPDIRVQLFLTSQVATLYLDTSGDALFKRGYRQHAGEAPLRENLAAGLLALTGWKPGQALYDPMCGSGTLLTEAAMMARCIAPGLGRSFAFQKLRTYCKAEWEKQIDEAKLQENKEIFPIYGSDLSNTAIAHANANLEKIGVADTVVLKQLDILDTQPPAAPGVFLCNPPYGVRLDEQQVLTKAYPLWGDVLKQRFAGWQAYFFTSDLSLAKKIGLKATKRTVLFNGALECRLFEYVMQAGSLREIPIGFQDTGKASTPTGNNGVRGLIP